MYTPAARRGSSLLVTILLLIAILLEQSIAGLCPWLSQMGGIRPMIVFLDIPVRSPVTIDWLPVGFLFISFLCYCQAAPGERAGKEMGRSNRSNRMSAWAVLGRWWLLLLFLLAGGGLSYFLADHLPKQVRNGIDSFGIRADLVLPYPSGETVHLEGGMILLLFCIIGWRLLIRKAAWSEEIVVAGAAVVESVKEEPAPSPIPQQGRIIMRIPEPVEVKSVPAPRRCVSVIMPAAVPRRYGIYPCIVEEE